MNGKDTFQGNNPSTRLIRSRSVVVDMDITAIALDLYALISEQRLQGLKITEERIGRVSHDQILLISVPVVSQAAKAGAVQIGLRPPIPFKASTTTQLE